jgi:8-oxo-dGTP diphosphatase
MRWSEQGIDAERYAVIPRTLCFLFHHEQVLLLRGAADKRLWAGRLNGIGGHVEPGEDVAEAARREIAEEAGIAVQHLCLCGIVHVSAAERGPGVVLFVFAARVPEPTVRSGREGQSEWHALDALPLAEMIADLPSLLPRVVRCLHTGEMIYGLYTMNADGQMGFRFSTADDAAEGSKE